MNIASFLVPSLKLAEERPIDKSDYENYIQTSSDLLGGINEFDVEKDKESINCAIIFIAEHSNISGWSYDEESMCWSSENHAEAAEIIKNKIVNHENKSFQVFFSNEFLF